MNAQNHNNLIADLATKKLLDKDLKQLENQALPFTEIYLSETSKRESLRYMKRRRFYIGPGLTQRAKEIIETVSKYQYIGDSTKHRMLGLLKKPVDDDIEYLVDNISVWQYLSEMKLSKSELSKVRLNEYLLELEDDNLIDSIQIHKINNYRDVVSQLNNTLILEISAIPDFSSIREELNSKDNIQKLGLNENDYQAIKTIDIYRMDEINRSLKEQESVHRILTISDQNDLTWLGLIKVNSNQYEVFKRWEKDYEYPFYNVDWFVVKLFPETEFK